MVLSWGLGVDSTALLLRWLTDPDSRDFALSDLIVVTAMTGDEHAITGTLAQEHVLPRLAAAGVRLVQVARAGPHQADGITVLDDSTQPSTLCLEGAYALSDELDVSGTIPQVGGARLCSVKFKGWVIDTFLDRELGTERFRQAIGFEDSPAERRRALRDASFNTGCRTGWYPLQDWGWSRTRCLAFLEEATGVRTWPKSACVYCPFALTSKAGLLAALTRFRDRPEGAVTVLAREHHALALNPRQGLIAGRRLRDELAAAGNTAALELFAAHLETRPHALYEVRRIVRPMAGQPNRAANASRHLRVLATGSRPSVEEHLAHAARESKAAVDRSDVAARAWLRRRSGSGPGVEHFFVAGTAGAEPKGDPHFERWWRAETAMGVARTAA